MKYFCVRGVANSRGVCAHKTRGSRRIPLCGGGQRNEERAYCGGPVVGDPFACGHARRAGGGDGGGARDGDQERFDDEEWGPGGVLGGSVL